MSREGSPLGARHAGAFADIIRAGRSRREVPVDSSLTVVLLAVALAAPARAANKDIERLQIQIAALQGQIADLQRASEESLKEIKRLNEVLAEQNATLQKGVAGPAGPGRGAAGRRCAR